MKIFIESDDATLKVEVTEFSMLKTTDGSTIIQANRQYNLCTFPAPEKPKAEPKKKPGPKPAAA